MAETMLEMFRRHVTESERMLAEQEQLIERLRSEGADTAVAERELTNCRKMTAEMRSHLLAHDRSTGAGEDASEPPLDHGPLIYWEFRCDDDGAWTWRTVRTDGGIISHSMSLPSMQRAVMDAKSNGFNVDADHWSVTAHGRTSTFEPHI